VNATRSCTRDDARPQQIGETHAVQHLHTHPIDDGEGYRGTILTRIDVNTERTFTEGRIDDADDRAGNCAGIGVLRDDLAECALDLLLDASFTAVRRSGHVVSCLGWGTHSLAPLSFKAASYSGVFTLLPLLTGASREHHGMILQEATRLVETTKVAPAVDPKRFSLGSVADAYAAMERGSSVGKRVIEI
jgi:hypothetical protein